MSGTRSPSPRAQATDPERALSGGLPKDLRDGAATSRTALIIAHGSPSHAEAAEAQIRTLAEEVQARAPDGLRVFGATLANRGSLEAAIAEAGTGRLAIYPHFMSDGWFVSSELPRRLRRAGLEAPHILPPLGLEPALAALCARRVSEAIRWRALPAEKTTLVLAAHGSPSDPRPAEATRRVADRIAEANVLAALRIGFVDEEPRIVEAARCAPPALCLPFFIGRGGHVLKDLREALSEARFEGAVLEPIGLDVEIPDLIARVLQRPWTGDLAAVRR